MTGMRIIVSKLWCKQFKTGGSIWSPPWLSKPTSMEKKCVGFHSCKDNTCVKRCRNSGCPVVKPPAKCSQDLCKATKCDKSVSCVINHCGGCAAVHFDKAGNRVCLRKGDANRKTKCRSSDDCTGDDQYCGSQGLCHLKGTCMKAKDCKLPSNAFQYKKTCKAPAVVDFACKRNECKANC